MQENLQEFHPVIGKWFEERLGVPTPPQVMGWPLIAAEKSVLILAPTGSGKTLAAFLAAIDWLARRLLQSAPPGKPSAEPGTGGGGGVQILYVSPLKSLANDVQKNLLKPLGEIAGVAAAGKISWPEIRVAVRTGDTPQKERAAIARRPPHILITTPESLNLMLTSGARHILAATRFVIVDEVHALAGSKRGVFLSLVLERLEHERESGRPPPSACRLNKECHRPLVRIGLSATARPEDRIARWLAGYDNDRKPRPIEVVKSGQRKRLDLGVICPFGGPDEPVAQDPAKSAGHWPEVTRAILQLIREHRSTLVFGNSRRLIERFAARFQEELAGEAIDHESHPDKPAARMPVILPHHGSIAKEVRLETEQALKRGEVDAVLATSSLELGIDIGALDLVVQIDSPGNIAAGLQRVGRAGHLEKATAKGRLLARSCFDIASLATLVPLMYAGIVEKTCVPENCLDVLAQQIVAACAGRGGRAWNRGELFRLLRRATPYHTLDEKQFDSVVTMLSRRSLRVISQGDGGRGGGGPRPRLSFDRVNDELIIMPGAAKVVMVNSGVISDTGAYPVYLVGAKKDRIATHGNLLPPSPLPSLSPSHEFAQNLRTSSGKAIGARIGELDEEFVYECREGDRFVLGSQTWQIVRIEADRVLVEHAAPGASRMIFWRGEQAPRSEMLGDALVRFLGELERRLWTQDDESICNWLMEVYKLDERAAENAVGFYRRQLAGGWSGGGGNESGIPTDQRLIVEYFTDRTGEPIVAILCPLGSRVNYTLRLALEFHFSRRGLPAQIVHNDDGLMIRPSRDVGEMPESPLTWLRAANLEQEIVEQLETSALFGLRFRQNAARALMLPRMTVWQRTPLWQQRLRARHLLAMVKKQRNFPIIVETYRECLQDVLGVERVQQLLREIETGRLAVTVLRHTVPSPLARSLFSQFQQTYLYAWDDPLTQGDVEPTVDQAILDGILQRRTDEASQAAGPSPSWADADEEALRRRIIGADYPARSAEELLEKIEAAGAVGLPADVNWAEYVIGDVNGMLAELTRKSRLFLVDFADTSRWVATENLALLLVAVKSRPRLRRLGDEPPAEPGADRHWAAARWSDIPPALLACDIDRDEARRLMVEQAIRQRTTITAEEIVATLPWLAKEVPGILGRLMRAGVVQSVGGDRLVWGEYAEQLRGLALRRQRRVAATVDVASLQRHLLHWQHVDSPREGIEGLEEVLDMLVGLALPLETWELEVLPTRVKGFMPAMLDAVCGTGRYVWVGGEDEVVSFWPRQLLAMRSDKPPAEPGADKAGAILEFLQKQGASFLLDIQLALRLDDAETALTLQELAFAGRISNDQLEGLRDVQRLAGNARRDRVFRSERSSNRYPPSLQRVQGRRRLPGGWWKERAGGGGRWFVLPEVEFPGSAIEMTELAADRVDRLLRRTGFACREMIEAGIDGPWRDCYDVLSRMEWAGAVRRGYFVEGISGSQFALPVARLESLASHTAVQWLAMLDPANVWARVDARWLSEAGESIRIPRTPGNWIALVEGRPVLAAVNWAHRLVPLPASWEQHLQALQAIPALLPRQPRLQHPHLDVRQWDQQDIIGSRADEPLRCVGFTRNTQELRLYRKYTDDVSGNG
ncbi:MAG: DEAD/DEAH box helicase [Phycisphaerales bacterium]|nr:DEAD/DEAH box helicase [Phycisphaerales bacterium]